MSELSFDINIESEKPVNFSNDGTASGCTWPSATELPSAENISLLNVLAATQRAQGSDTQAVHLDCLQGPAKQRPIPANYHMRWL